MAALSLKPTRYIIAIGIIAILIFAGGTVILHTVPLAIKGKVANGLLGDFMLTFPLLYYLIVLRPQKKSVTGLWLVFTVCCALAYIILPQQQRGYILQIRKLSILLELGVIIYVISRFTKIRTSYMAQQAIFADPVYNLRFAMAAVLGNAVIIKILASELALMRYGLLFWKKEKPLTAGSIAFTTYKDSGYIAMWSVLCFVMAIETVAFHLFLQRWSNMAAIIVTLLTAYTFILLLADLSAIVKRHAIISGQQLVLRTGLRWRVITDMSNINSVQKITNDYSSDAEYLRGGILKSSGNVVINLKNPVNVEKLYGKDREVLSILMNMDNADAFIDSCNTSTI